MRPTLPMLACAAFLLASCGDETTSSSDDTSFPAHREIGASLRKTCPEIPASRSADGTSGASVTVGQNVVQHMTYGIYDTTGTLVAQGAQDLTVPDNMVGYTPRIAWNGKDAAGNNVPTGHYFIFIEVRDEAGTLVGSNAACIGMVSNT